MDPSASLQIPDSSLPGSSRQTAYRPASVAVNSTTASQSTGRHHRASHNVVSSSQQQQENLQNEQPAYRDVYSHPAAIAYAAAHPRRTIPKFGPYLLLQTLGEGEFGKVKLGLHSQWGEEVAVKLIRRGNIDSSVRMSKVEREIEVLRTLKHPNIVRLYDVIETDKYIGIILEYASGGELFDHILAHRYLKEKDACKLFSQLISGVWYIHQKKIVHRDLKLENLLLDRNRNVIITDFGFANRFEHRADDLMQTSCGSPCYAAPELVISEGLYVGSAVDIWSCGVILYAMLAGYLPFDDDPDNPDGDNINLLYKYIVNTTLTFPPHISQEARELLSLMLVANPTQRADLPSIMRHEWLAPYHHVFTRSVDNLERAAMEQHQLKRMAYQRQMTQAQGQVEVARGIARTQSARTDALPSPPVASSSSRTRSHREGHHHQQQHVTQSQTQPEYLYETSVDQSMYSSPSNVSTPAAASRRGYNSAVVAPSIQPVLDDDPFAPTPSVSISPAVTSQVDEITAEGDMRGEPRRRRDEHEEETERRPSSKNGQPSKSSPESGRKKTGGGFRHTIQVEYGQNGQEQPGHAPISPPARRDMSDVDMRVAEERLHSAHRNGQSSPERTRASRKGSVDSASKPLPAVPPSTSTASTRRQPSQRKVPPSESSVISYSPTSPRVHAPSVSSEEKQHLSQHGHTGSQSSGSASSKISGHKKGMSADKLGLSKFFGGSSDATVSNGMGSRVPSENSQYGANYSENGTTKSLPGMPVGGRPSTYQKVTPSQEEKKTSTLLSPAASDTGSSGKKNRRNTLTVMVEPISRSIKARTKGRVVTADASTKEKEMGMSPITGPKSATAAIEKSELQPPPTPTFPNVSRTSVGLGMQASTSKARKVMQWFRSKSKGRESFEVSDDGHVASPSEGRGRSANQPPSSYKPGTPGALPSTVSGSSGVHVFVTPTSAQRSSYRSSSGITDTFIKYPGWRSGSTAAKSVLRVHHGAVDQTMVTTRPPPEVMRHIRDILESMGIVVQYESDYKYRCIRPKRKKSANAIGLGLKDGPGGSVAAFTIHGSAASNGVDKRGLPVPSHSSFGSGGMLRGLLMRRQSSQVSSIGQQSLESEAPDVAPAGPTNASFTGEPTAITEPLFGDRTQDVGDEVRFSCELTRIDRLNDTYSLDIRRLKGNLRSYKFLYDTLRDRADLQ